MSRIVEAYVGEYASGKSECAVNRALALVGGEEPVTLVDLDFVEPFYTLRPIREKLKGMGLNVMAWLTEETMGFGETGVLIKPEMRWALRQPGHVIMDIGYGIKGSRTLNLVEGIWDDPDLRIIAVINIGRPMTGSLEDVVEYIQSLGTVHGLINNSHLGDDTYVEFIQEGAVVVSKAGKTLGIPLVATCADEKFRSELGEQDRMGNPIRYLRRYMTKTFW